MQDKTRQKKYVASSLGMTMERTHWGGLSRKYVGGVEWEEQRLCMLWSGLE
jgi:hypothetical protein